MEVKQLLCHIPFCGDGLVLSRFNLSTALSFTAVCFHPSLKAHTHSQPGCGMFSSSYCQVKQAVVFHRFIKPAPVLILVCSYLRCQGNWCLE